MPEPTPELVKPEFDQAEVGSFLDHRVCARCYNDLTKMPGSKTFMWAVTCPTCGPAWNYTTVSRRYVESLGQQALADRAEALKRFADILPPKPQRTEQQILAELGY